MTERADAPVAPSRRLKADDVRRECAERGIAIEQRGRAFSLVGDGVDIIVAELSEVHPFDLAPVKQSTRRGADRER